MSEKLYPLVGSIFGVTVGRQGHNHTEKPWCEECEAVQQESRYFKAPPRARVHGHEDHGGRTPLNMAVLKGMLAERPQVGCWHHVERKRVRTQLYVSPCYCEECPRLPNHKWMDHYMDPGMTPDFARLYDTAKPKTARRSCDYCPCPRRKWVYQDREVWVPKPGHMLRCGIPWSKRYAPKDYKGVLMQDFVCTFGRRYVSPNYWTSNAPHPAFYNDYVYPSASYMKRMNMKREDRYKAIYTRLRPYGGSAFHVFPSLDAAVPFVRRMAQAFQYHLRMRSAGKRDCDPYQLEAAFFRWARLGKVPLGPAYVAKRTAQLGKNGIAAQWQLDRESGKKVDPSGRPYTD